MDTHKSDKTIPNQSETPTCCDHTAEVSKKVDLIDRQAALDVILPYCPDDDGTCSKSGDDLRNLLDDIENLPSAQPFHNTTLSEVLAYIDGMPEDVWQEFTACLECRGWYLVRREAKMVWGEFA